jgi:HK97 family phage major capsid protein
MRDAAPTAAERKRTVPSLSVAALTERRSAIDTEAATIRTIAETEGRDLSTEDRDALTALDGRRANIDALITDASSEAQRRDAERRALPSGAPRSGAVVTRAETVYGPGSDRSFFADLMVANRDAGAAERMGRHKALVLDLASQLERRATTSADIAGAYPVSNYPDLYVPDVSYNGPFASFFATTPITAPNPISVPSFAAVTGDTAPQTAENTPVSNVDVTTAPKALTPKTIGGESVVSRQSVDGASPGTDVIIGNQLRELLMRDTEREIALVLEALTAAGTIADTAGTTPAASGRDLYKGIASKLGQFYAGAAAGGAGARFLPAEGVFVNSTDWGNLCAGEDTAGRPLMPFINPVNALGTLEGTGFQRGVIGGVPVEPAWALLDPKNEIIARRNDGRQWKSAVLDIRLMEREGPQSVVFAIWQYFGFAVLEPKGVRKYTYTNV